MLLSMTGFGEAQRQADGVTVSIEVRTINSRYFKLNLRTAEGFSGLEPQLEAEFRKQIRRGTVQANLRIDREASADDYCINPTVLSAYQQQLKAYASQASGTASASLDTLLTLPGVVEENSTRKTNVEGIWPLIRDTAQAALENLTEMRTREGEAMAADLAANAATIAVELEHIAARSPEIAEAYATRLTDRLNSLLEKHGVQVEASDVVREVGIFAERADISEEIVRLRSHLEQFDEVAASDDSVGRKLEFITQEMFREVNTIGSKANDATVARHVVEIKAAIERMREMIQNVE